MNRNNVVAHCLSLLLIASFINACSADNNFLPTFLSTPTAMALAGPDHNRLFIANSSEDNLQVGLLGNTLRGFDFIRADAIHFPLHIAAGPSPRALAATPDGRYVVVLNGSGETLRLIDAQALIPAINDNAAVIIKAGPADSAPADLVAAITQTPDSDNLEANTTIAQHQYCAAPCLGRFFVALSNIGSVVSFEVREEESGPTIEPIRNYAVGGNPIKLAVHPNGNWLFAIDASDNTVLRIDLASGIVIERLNINAQPGTLVVSKDGTALIVTRPMLYDLVIFDDITSAAASIVDSNSTYVKAPECIEACNASELKCINQHPSDTAICSLDDNSGLQTVSGHEYQAVYLGAMPTSLLALGAKVTITGSADSEAASASSLSITCNEQKYSYSQSLLVSLFGGPLEYVGLRSTPDAPLKPTLLSATACEAPSIEMATKEKHPEIAAPEISSFLGPCPITPERERFVCADGGNGSGVVVMPGLTASGTWVFDWEGVIINRSTGGRVDIHTPQNSSEANFTFVDVAYDFSEADVVAGDILQFITRPRQDSACQAVVGSDPQACELEWRILAIDKSQTVTKLILEAKDGIGLSPKCFLTDGSIAYRTRVSHRYVIYHGDKRVGRAQYGDVIGRGGNVGINENILFSISAPNIEADTNSCDFYDQAGLALNTEKRSLYSRDNPFAINLTDTWVTMLAGYDLSETTVPTAGEFPTDMTLATLANGKQIVFVIYAASNSMLLFEPYNIDVLNNESYSRVIR